MKSTAVAAASLATLVTVTAVTLRAEDPDPTEARAIRGAPPAQGWQHLALQQDADTQFTDAEFAKKINRIGKEGWELVSVANLSVEGTTTKSVYYFKRPL